MKRGIENIMAIDAFIQLGELTIHQQDIRRPLDLPRDIPTPHLQALLDCGLTRLGDFGLGAKSRRHAAGLHLAATDTDWSAGFGPPVAGPAEALLMAVNGRREALANLTGAGGTILADRLAA